MARSSQKEPIPQPQEQSLTLSQQPSHNPVSLQGPPADVPQYGPTPEIVIGKVDPKPVAEPAPAPVVEIDDDGSITIR
jgi:hypothetical protein